MKDIFNNSSNEQSCMLYRMQTQSVQNIWVIFTQSSMTSKWYKNEQNQNIDLRDTVAKKFNVVSLRKTTPSRNSVTSNEQT